MLSQTKNQALQRIEAEAAATARQNRGQMTPAMYVDGGHQVRMTKERAYAAALEADPESYEAYRAQHNAAAIIAQLERAGIRLAR